MTELSKNLAELRKKKKFSQSQVAEQLFVTPQAVSRWERGETEPDVDTLVKIAEIYGVSVEEVVGGASTNKINKTLDKVFHLTYIIYSSLLIIFSIVLIVLSILLDSVQYLFYAFIIVSMIYLVLILAIEITKDIVKKKGTKKNEK